MSTEGKELRQIAKYIQAYPALAELMGHYEDFSKALEKQTGEPRRILCEAMVLQSFYMIFRYGDEPRIRPIGQAREFYKWVKLWAEHELSEWSSHENIDQIYEEGSARDGEDPYDASRFGVVEDKPSEH